MPKIFLNFVFEGKIFQIWINSWYNRRKSADLRHKNCKAILAKVVPSGCEADIWRMCARHDESMRKQAHLK